GADWHPGVVGIVASRLKEAANRPALVIGLKDGVGVGSGRSISGIDLGAPIQRLAHEGLLIKGGGHKMAAGLTVAEDRMEDAMARLSELLARQGAADRGAADLRLDGVLFPGAATLEMIEQLTEAGPFGAGAPTPRFAMADMHIYHTRRIGETHLKLSFGSLGGARLDGIAFGAYDSALGPILEAAEGRALHLAGRIEKNTYLGRVSVQLQIEDAASPTP
ncbi:MAG: DHHA1 domain-containing protein, partial [Pseudomonadota bacterium]